MNAALHISDLEAAINWWRDRRPSADGLSACAEVQALAEVYGRLVFERAQELPEDALPPLAAQAWASWYASTPDAPCIAVCSTAQGDPVCKGCGRTEGEVQHWPAFSPAHKRAVWRRITAEGSAWRFNRYAERAAENRGRPST